MVDLPRLFSDINQVLLDEILTCGIIRYTRRNNLLPTSDPLFIGGLTNN